jgi:hypothetical protein
MAALIAKDRVAEATTVTSTGNITLGGAIDADHRTVASAFADGAYAPFTVYGGGQWLSFLGTYNAGTNEIARTTFVASSTGSNINFNAGTKTVICGLLGSLMSVGRQSIWLDARGAKKRTTNGPADDALETATNKVMLDGIGFDASTIEYVQWRWRMPKQWDKGAISFVPVWRHLATTTNFKVSWGLQAAAFADTDAGDFAFGTAIYSNDTGGTTASIYIGPESASVTVSGSPGDEELVVFQGLRKADDGTNDTLAVDAVLLGFVIYINTIAGSDT